MSKYILYYKKDETLKETKHDSVMDNLYELKAKLPTVDNIKDYIKSGKSEEIKSYIKSKSPEEIVREIQIEISTVDNKVPLYDSFKKNLYVIHKENVYNRVMYESYRFPSDALIGRLLKRRKTLTPLVKKISAENSINEDEAKLLHGKIRLEEEYHKLGLMLDYFKNFDIPTLENTYIKVFYYYANEVGKNITVCERPSFMPHFLHLKPYYTRSELINLALNMGIISQDSKYYDKDSILDICDKVIENDVSADTITKHQEHIIKENKIGVVQYYSLQGSFFMNNYLRGFDRSGYRNELLETIIKSTWELILSAPSFDKNYTLYRFISRDDYLQHLSIGDEYVDPSFISTTRDPFYKTDAYEFGFILLKIHIPAGVKGVGLCLESYSLFPEEQEIILPPHSILRLDKKDENALYYHTDKKFALNVTRRYEFTLVTDRENTVQFQNRETLPEKTPVIDFINIEADKNIGTVEKIRSFINQYVNELNQFKTKIGGNDITLIVERYDSTTAYRKFYASTTNNGYQIYTFYKDYILLVIELGETDNEPYMYVNFYFRHAAVDQHATINDVDLVVFLSKVAYYFHIENIVLYSKYTSCDSNRSIKESDTVKVYHGGNFCSDFYRYLKHNERRFKSKELDVDTTVIRPVFSYYDLDRLKKLSPMAILNRDDTDEIFQIYNKIYKLYFADKKSNLADFYVWMIENHCVYLKILTRKMQRIFGKDNPFNNDKYIIYPTRFLYNNGLIKTLPNSFQLQESEMPRGDRIPKNNYRVEKN